MSLFGGSATIRARVGLRFNVSGIRTLTLEHGRAIRSAAANSAREAAREAAERVIEGRRDAERVKLRKRLKELGG